MRERHGARRVAAALVALWACLSASRCFGAPGALRPGRPGRQPGPRGRRGVAPAAAKRAPPATALGAVSALAEPGALLSSSAWDDFGRQAGLSVAGEAKPRRGSRDGPPDTDEMREKMKRDGYSSLARSDWDADPDLDKETLASMDRAVDLLEEAGLPPQFLLVFDEVWDVVDLVSRALEPVYGLQNIFDFFVFNVNPGKGGWTLHRDRPSGAVGFQEDGTPDYTTVWVAITDASPSTSCIYVLPAHADPEYKAMKGSQMDLNVVAHFLHHVTALPVERGTVLHWSHRVLHWGSASPVGAPAPRRTLTFAMARPSYEQPLLRLEPGATPSFEARLALIAYTLIGYHHSQPVPEALRAPLVDIILKHSEHLSAAALIQSTGESFFKNLMQIGGGGDTELAASCESLGEQVLKQFDMKADWWSAQWAAFRVRAK